MSPCVFKACRKPSLLSAFSLIELLVVIAIVLALAGIAVNGISNSSQNARQTCREIVKAHLQQARIHAIATHRHTALIIPVRSSGVNGLHEISMIEVERGNDGYISAENESGDAALLQKWSKLPKNFHFVTNTMIGSDLLTVVDHEETLTLMKKGHKIECHMVVFAPNGQIIHPMTSGRIHIAIAEVTRKGDAFRISQITNDQPVFDLLEVNRLTAKTRNFIP